MRPDRRTRKDRADLGGVVADRDHVIERPVEVLGHRLRAGPGVLDPVLVEDGERARAYDSLGPRARGIDRDPVRPEVAQDPLGQDRPARVARAQHEDPDRLAPRSLSALPPATSRFNPSRPPSGHGRGPAATDGSPRPGPRTPTRRL